jgi:hypothetical protein
MALNPVHLTSSITHGINPNTQLDTLPHRPQSLDFSDTVHWVLQSQAVVRLAGLDPSPLVCFTGVLADVLDVSDSQAKECLCVAAERLNVQRCEVLADSATIVIEPKHAVTYKDSDFLHLAVELVAQVAESLYLYANFEFFDSRDSSGAKGIAHVRFCLDHDVSVNYFGLTSGIRHYHQALAVERVYTRDACKTNRRYMYFCYLNCPTEMREFLRKPPEWYVPYGTAEQCKCHHLEPRHPWGCG